jgi:L-alanine-DL-glutamate epimerase-like enolase superfamily enzyme
LLTDPTDADSFSHQLQIAHAGGITETRKIAIMAEAYDVGVAPHCPLGPIAFAASLAVAASTPNFVICEMSIGMHYNAGQRESLHLASLLHLSSLSR